MEPRSKLATKMYITDTGWRRPASKLGRKREEGRRARALTWAVGFWLAPALLLAIGAHERQCVAANADALARLQASSDTLNLAQRNSSGSHQHQHQDQQHHYQQQQQQNQQQQSSGAGQRSATIANINEKEEPAISQTAANGSAAQQVGRGQLFVAPTSRRQATATKGAGHQSRRQERAKYSIGPETKVVFVDESNEIGLLEGRIEANRSAARRGFDEQPGGGGGATNYSVYLISSDARHIAIVLDIEQIDFEPMINCEYQELRLSIVGEISTDILNRRRANESLPELAGLIDEEDFLAAATTTTTTTAPATSEEAGDGDGGGGDGEPEESGADLGQKAQASMPVSEAMALLLNAPLSKTILRDSSEANNFKVIDTTIDYLRTETCKQLQSHQERVEQQQQQQQQQLLQQAKKKKKSKTRNDWPDTEAHKPNSERRSAPPNRRQQGRRGGGAHANSATARHNHQARDQNEALHSNAQALALKRACQRTNDTQFRHAFAKTLEGFLAWDDFKIVCGYTRQIIVPMRSLKLSLYSDEFAPSSRFQMGYRFVSEPRALPGHSSGEYVCRNRNVIDLELKCNGYDDCGDASDESIKICGYPSARASDLSSASALATAKGYHQRRQRAPSCAPSPSPPPPLNGHHERQSALATPQVAAGGAHSAAPIKRQKLVYFDGDVLNCCQSSDWQQALQQGRQANQAAPVLQSLLGDSMQLFSGPLFAPTRNGAARHHQRGRRSRPRRVKRIVGGAEAHRNSWPGQVSLQYELIEPLCHFCAGTLIHPQYVVTAGHCITKDGLNRGIKIVLGAHDLRQQNGSQIQVRYVDDAHIYPGVDVKHLSFDWENDMNNDIALLRLNAPVLITPHVAPACLPPFNTPLAVNTSCRSIGWGQTHGSGSSNLLKHLALKVVDSAECSREMLDRDNGRAEPPAMGERRATSSEFEMNGVETYSNRTMVCVNNDQGHGICQGDSGGPLYCDRQLANGEQCTEIYGVASFIIQYATVGAMCAVENLPGIFGELSSKTEWIASTIKMFEQSYKLKYSP